VAILAGADQVSSFSGFSSSDHPTIIALFADGGEAVRTEIEANPPDDWQR